MSLSSRVCFGFLLGVVSDILPNYARVYSNDDIDHQISSSFPCFVDVEIGNFVVRLLVVGVHPSG